MIAQCWKRSYTCYGSASVGTCVPGLCTLMWQYGVAGGWVAIEMLDSWARCPYKRAVLTRYWRQWGRLLLTRLPRHTALHFTDPPVLDTKLPCARCAPLLWNPIKSRAPWRTHWSRFANEPQVGDYIRGSADRLFYRWILSVMLHNVRFSKSTVWEGRFI